MISKRDLTAAHCNWPDELVQSQACTQSTYHKATVQALQVPVCLSHRTRSANDYPLSWAVSIIHWSHAASCVSHLEGGKQLCALCHIRLLQPQSTFEAVLSMSENLQLVSVAGLFKCCWTRFFHMLSISLCSPCLPLIISSSYLTLALPCLNCTFSATWSLPCMSVTICCSWPLAHEEDGRECSGISCCRVMDLMHEHILDNDSHMRPRDSITLLLSPS